MEIKQQLIFLFSTIGGLNGILFGLYFLFSGGKQKASRYFLSALFFVLSIRILKSVFFYFNRDLSEVFIQIGLSACVLIGPFLYLYTKSWWRSERSTPWFWHIFPALSMVTILGLLFPYHEFKYIWSPYIVKGIYLQWLVYLIANGILLKEPLRKLFSPREKVNDSTIWIVSIYFGIIVIWIGYNVGAFTSYIVGAMSSSFAFYILVLFWVLKQRNSKPFYEEPTKYDNKKIDQEEASEIQIRLRQYIQEKALFKNPNLKLADVAKELNVLPHYLSQILNDNLGKSFSSYINEYRIEEAKNLLIKSELFTTEAVGYECGFNSKSTFFSAFKKVVGTTPANYRSEHKMG
ncbi:MAG: helix-turn-helix transcriptional regulator [Bacteroidota bacterium]